MNIHLAISLIALTIALVGFIVASWSYRLARRDHAEILALARRRQELRDREFKKYMGI